MGQKIRPDSFRLGITRPWLARWFPKHKNFRNELEEDVIIRKTIKEKIAAAGLVQLTIERGPQLLYRIGIKVARPGLVIGRGGKGVEELNRLIERRLTDILRRRNPKALKPSINLTIEELKRSEVSAAYVAQLIAWDLEKRLRARRTMKKHLEEVMQHREVKGAKIRLSGRIDGAEISRREWLAKGSLPLQTLRADIDYGEATAIASFGTVGIKVWIYRGELFAKQSDRDRGDMARR